MVTFHKVTSTDQLLDLLCPGVAGEVTVGGTLRGVSSVTLESAAEARQLVKAAQQNRSPNAHQITQVQVSRRDEAAAEIVQSKLLLVDLVSAGSCSLVSRQLSLLEHVVVALGSKSKNIRVPFRQCRLTHALQVYYCQHSLSLTLLSKGALGNKCNTALLCTIRPGNAHMSDTLASLRFASRAAKIPITQDQGCSLSIAEIIKSVIAVRKKAIRVNVIYMRERLVEIRFRNRWLAYAIAWLGQSQDRNVIFDTKIFCDLRSLMRAKNFEPL